MKGIVSEKYQSGINLGGWISQCDEYSKEHVNGFIRKEDIGNIASWGFDHVRLPFDYPILEDDGNPFVYLEGGFAVIDRLIGWCKEFGLNVVLDMHEAPGYSFYNNDSEDSIFEDRQAQRRFVSLWEEMARRYKPEGENVIFELLNEIKDPHGGGWNKIARAAINGIREIDAERYILLGGPNYNAASGLDTLEIWDDERILYNFHFYEPMVVTHQNASWTELKDSGVSQPYPGKIEKFGIVSKLLPHFTDTADTVLDKAHLETLLSPALTFAKRTGKQLYCGEYGVIDRADMQSRLNWLRDVTELFNENHIGKAYWTYKAMNFSTIDNRGNPVSEELIKIISSRFAG